VRVRARDLLRQGRLAHREGRHSEAVILFFRATVARLTERGLLLDDRSRTNREHLRDLRRREREAKALSAVIPGFERVRYGKREATNDDAELALSTAVSLFPEDTR
jgi:hypothetical protein